MRQFVLGLLVFVPLTAQEFVIPPGIERLADRASEVVDVTLDQSLLQLASKFLSGNDAETARVRRMVAGLKGISVRSYQFERPGEYSLAEVDQVRAQLRAPGWARIVGVRKAKSGQNSEVYLRSEGGNIVGLAVVAAEPRELTIVNINGSLRPEDLQELGGHFGIPRMESDLLRKDRPADKKED